MVDPVLSIRHLSKRFGAVQASDDVSLSVLPGKLHALIGPNGAGKSTLIGQISGFLAPDEGRIFLNGKDVTDLSSERRVHLGLGRSFQVSNLLLEWSARRNVMLAVQARQGGSFRFFANVWKDQALRVAAEDALRKVGLAERAEIRAMELSHGERRQLEFACALALKPKLLVLDEPMAGLGPEGTNSMTLFLDQLKQTVPILLVEHDMDAVFRLADEISVLVYGRIIASGTPADIRNSKLVQEAYLGGAGDVA
uniref:ABC transporter ATP-binding protein n=1 Tax=Pararhizobium sp. IMCC3301 TaxID=3067904 RepID=UPI00274292C2|nr:ABC transporter ATP-binding protein [Pararhizobium sp. IMCC3301]